MFSAAPAEPGAANPARTVARAVGLDVALFVALAGGTALAASLYGAFAIDVWAPLGVLLVSVVGALLVAGRRPPGSIALAAAALLLLGLWSLASTSWGGLRHEAWLQFDQYVVAAAALVAGSLLTSLPGRRGLVLAAVAAGVTVHALDVLVRLAIPLHPEEWLHARFLEGPVGYHNAQAVVLALAVPLALWLGDHERAAVRLLGGASAAVLGGTLLLTQSRGALLALVVGVAVHLAWAHRASLLVPVVALAAALGALVLPLRAVDAAILAGSSAEQLEALRRYGLWTALAALGVAAAAAAAHSRAVSRLTAIALAAVLVAATVAVGVQKRETLLSPGIAVPALPGDVFPEFDPGETRIRSLSPNGRRDAWRVAAAMVAERPLVGAGYGQFARRWTEERRLPNLYILQPHSIELELAAELGAVGVAFFAVFVCAAAYALVSTSRRRVAAAALGAATVLLVEASLDWTWSFPGIVAPTLLVVGAAAGSRTLRPARVLPVVGVVAATGALVAALAFPYVAAQHVERARDLAATGPDAARAELDTARTLSPWSAPALSLTGELAERAGEYELAAERYREAAEHTRRPWLERYRQARALALAGDAAAARAACERAVAANPSEPRLYEGPCLYDEGGDRWPVVESAGRWPGPFAAFSASFVDKQCSDCTIGVAGSELVASVAGEARARDTAYAVLELEPRPYRPLVVRDVVRLPLEQEITSHAALLHVRDEEDALLYELYLSGRDGTLGLYSPAGGLQATEINKSTGVELHPGGEPRAVEVTALPNHSVTVRVDGVERLRLGGLDGATGGSQRFLRVGVIARSGWSAFAPARVAHADVAVRYARRVGSS